MATITAVVQATEKGAKEFPTAPQLAEPVQQQPTLLGVAASAAKHQLKLLRLSSVPRSFHNHWQNIRSWVWFWIEELFEEFQPWLKWLIFDAALTLVVGWLVKRVEAVRPLFEAVGWA